MARKLWCDRCHHQTDETDDEKKNWAHAKLSAIATGAVFETVDLCAECISKLRLFLQGAS